MLELNFKQCKGDPDVWMRPAKDGSCYEYVACYVDDLLISMKDPKEFCDMLKNKFNFKLKGDGPIDYHLGLNYFRDPDGTMVMQPKKYIKKILESFKNMFKEMPRKYKSPLEPDDHPEIDDSELCGTDDVSRYLTLIGQLQWLVTLGRFDIFSAVITMSRFRAAPRTGHMVRVKRIFGYIWEMKDGAIRIRVGFPDYSYLSHSIYDWEKTVYGNVCEIIPNDIPEPMESEVILTTFVDANLYHDMVTGRALTGILHLINQMPFDWFCKRQSTVETSTFGSKLVAARIAIEQIIDIRITLRQFGVPIRGMTYMFGDNQSVITNSTLPHSQLNKRHEALAYHKVREAIASKMVGFYKIDGNKNPSDVMSKHWAYNKVIDTLRPLLFWKGDTYPVKKKVISKHHLE
jgi:hypothetical protein